jgi:acetate kinase
MSSHILTINGGSSSIKFALFEAGDPPEQPPVDPRELLLVPRTKVAIHPVRSRRLLAGQIERIGLADPRLQVRDMAGKEVEHGPVEAADHIQAAQGLIEWLKSRAGMEQLAGIGHRVVHGGPNYFVTQEVDAELVTELHRISPLDPAHLPGEIALIGAFARQLPKVPQFACFDTAFHHDLPRVARLLPIPRQYEAQGVRRYGFHGLSYSFLLQELARVIGPYAAEGRVILAHLGSGASMAAVRDGQCIDTTMSFTPTAGLVMGTRCGDLDPGVLIHLMRAEGLTVDKLDDLLNRRSGLLGVSETSSDMRDLLAREATDSRAALAVALFCYQARKHIGALAAALGGLDTLVFSGGIGEHAPPVRDLICDELGFLGIRLDELSNATNSAVISADGAAVTVRVIPTDEERWIAEEVLRELDRINR